MSVELSATLKKNLKFYSSALLIPAAIALASGCSPRSLVSGQAKYQGPVVTGVETTSVGAPPSAGQKLADIKAQAALSAGVAPQSINISTPSSNPRVVSRVTLNKASLLERLFLYGSDLQYSTITDGGFSLIRQSETTGHTPVYFRIIDSRLEMLADQRHLFESDNNHPERLIHRFPIVAQDENTITIEINSASPVLNTVLGGSKAAPARTSWVRSVQFVEDGQYLMFETSVEMADGSVAEFMESFFPRDLLVDKDTQPILATADLEPNAERFRFLDSGDIFLNIEGKGRTKTKVASRFKAAPGKIVEWYITPNVPEEYLVPIKAAVEGWNRYSRKMWNQDIVAFKGILPAGVKLGDPRYNVINWDSVAKAGAAYESQASDPYTGIQSHSLIYLPKAWINIGKEYWEAGAPSDTTRTATERLKKSVQNASYLGKPLPVHCMADPFERLAIEAKVNPGDFSKELLKGVLFHEMGHAMGLAHNFKGSLSYNPGDNQTSFSTSIMDYNQYHLEKAAFESIESANGPLLEYDRQIMSVLYNSGKDIAASDAKVPVCNDEETDSSDDGVDPLCIRYDAGQDPTKQVELTIDLLKHDDATNRVQRSLSTSIKSLNSDLGDPTAFKTKEEISKEVSKLSASLNGLVGFYYVTGAQSLAYSTRINIRSLRQFKSDALPEGMNELEMRTRAMQALRYTTGVEKLEPAVINAIENFKGQVSNWLKSTAYISGVAADRQADEIKEIMKSLNAMPASLEQTILPRARTRVMADLTANENAPFYFNENGGATIDFEKEAAQILMRAAIEPLSNGSPRPVGERATAARSLRSFRKTAVGATYVNDAERTLQAQARDARNMEVRAAAVAVLKALSPSEESK